ncbi:OmpA family protein, partial [Salmonella enterica subsp. enterica serovar Bareilly]
TDYVAKKHAVDVLIQDEVLLDNNYRQGVPLRMGLGLYPGERLRQPLLATIATYLPPPPEKVQEKAKVVIPKAVRLDSLSLFDTNSA